MTESKVETMEMVNIACISCFEDFYRYGRVDGAVTLVCSKCGDTKPDHMPKAEFQKQWVDAVGKRNMAKIEARNNIEARKEKRDG